MSEQLKGCPHCGGKASSQRFGSRDGAPAFAVWCDSCSISTAWCHGDRGQERAIVDWNRRAPASEPAVDRDAERAAFEAWSSEAAPGHSIDRCRDSYESYPVASAWHAWQARAKLTTPAAPAVPATLASDDDEPRRAAWKDGYSIGFEAAKALFAITKPSPEAVPSPAPLVASERNFYARYGKRLSPESVHTCTPPAYLTPQVAQASPVLDDADIETVWLTMPGGPNGWLRSFGYLDFAQAIEELVLERLSERATGTDTSQGEA